MILIVYNFLEIKMKALQLKSATIDTFQRPARTKFKNKIRLPTYLKGFWIKVTTWGITLLFITNKFRISHELSNHLQIYTIIRQHDY